MKTKKRYILITGVISIISFFALFILQFRLYEGKEEIFRILFDESVLINLKEFGIIIFGGIFTGAILTFFLSIADYRSEKENALEDMFFEADELCKKFKNMKVFIPDEPWELVKDVFVEIEWNESADRTNKNIDAQLEKVKGNEFAIQELLQWKIDFKNDAEVRFKEYLWERTENKGEMEKYKEQHLDEVYNRKVEKYKKVLDEVFLDYLQFNSVSTRSLGNAYKKLDFMFLNKKKRNHIHKAIYNELYEKINLIKRVNPTIENYFKGDSIPRFLVMDVVGKVQKELIKEKEDFYFRKYAYSLSCELDQILIWIHKDRNQNELTKESDYTIRKQYGRGRILYDEE